MKHTLFHRLRAAWVPLVQGGAAAGIAWFLVHDVVGHQGGIFGPIGALYALSLGPGRRTRRVIEIAVGAALGVVAGGLLIAAIGTGPIQVAVVAVLAMGAAIVLGAGPAVVTQAGIASVLIATVEPPEGIYSALAAQRLVDILIGGGVGLAVSIVLPWSPTKSTQAAAAPFLTELRGTLEDIAAALDAYDVAAAERALERARTLDGYVRDLHHAVDYAAETTRLAPLHWRTRAVIRRQARAAAQLELAARNVRVLARAAVRAIELEPPTSPELALAVRELASAVRPLPTETDGDQQGETAARASAVRAAARATLAGVDSMSVGALVAQVRSTATDLLRALGLPKAEAIDRIRGAADAPANEPPAEEDPPPR